MHSVATTSRRRVLGGAAGLAAAVAVGGRLPASEPVMRTIATTGERVPAIGMIPSAGRQASRTSGSGTLSTSRAAHRDDDRLGKAVQLDKIAGHVALVGGVVDRAGSLRRR